MTRTGRSAGAGDRAGEASPARAPQPAEKAEAPTIRAAGTVLWRAGRAGVEVALVHRPRYDDWSFPKGKLAPGEHPVVAAVRETAEETGQVAVLGRRLPTQRYRVRGRRKRVRYWTARCAGDEPVPFTPNEEVDALAWLPLGTAAARLSYDRDLALLRAFEELPADTVPVTLLRHATAVPRDRWVGDDGDRPLSAKGRRQSRLVASVYACFAAGRLISSPARRCVDTLAELTKVGVGHSASGLPATPSALMPLTLMPLTLMPLTLMPQFSEVSYHRDERAAPALLRELLRDRPARAAAGLVICTHRPLLPGLYATAVTGTALPVRRSPLAPGEAFMLHLHDGAVIAADRVRLDYADQVMEPAVQSSGPRAGIGRS